MIKQHVSYEDFDGNVQEKDLWFHLNKSDLAKLGLKYEDGLMAGLTELQKKGDKQAIAEFIDTLLITAYGERVPGSDIFKKTPEIRENFQYSLAHDELLMMLIGGEDDDIINFIVGIMPGIKNEDRLRIIAQVKESASKAALPEGEVSENA